MRYDVCILLNDRLVKILPKVVAGIRSYLLNDNIVIIGKESLRAFCEREGCFFLDEDCLVKGLSFHRIRELLRRRNSLIDNRSGWYFQQFVKCGYARVCKKEYYLLWDADLIALNDISMFTDDDKPIFDIKTEYHKPYFSTMSRLFKNGEMKKKSGYSYISEHMIIKTTIMREMLDEIESNNELDGDLYFEKIINAIRAIDIMGSGFSEFETYGTYVENRYPDLYVRRKLRTLREGDFFLGVDPSEEILKWAGESYDLINLENRHDQLPEFKNNIDNLVDKSLKEVVAKYDEIILYG